jgi:putative transposase
MQNHLHIGRKSPARGVKINHLQPTIVFLTICAVRPATWLATNAAHASLVEVWRAADTWLVGDYLLMPDHLHLFCAPRDLAVTLEKWVTYSKRQFSRRHLDQSGWLWQRSFFDYRLRSLDSYREKLEYVRQNPVRKSLIASPDLWPYRGTIHPLRW